MAASDVFLSCPHLPLNSFPTLLLCSFYALIYPEAIKTRYFEKEEKKAERDDEEMRVKQREGVNGEEEMCQGEVSRRTSSGRGEEAVTGEEQISQERRGGEEEESESNKLNERKKRRGNDR